MPAQRATGGGQDDRGRGLLSVGSDIDLVEVHFLDNFAQFESAGVYSQVSTLTMIDGVIASNSPPWSGGGVSTSGSTLFFVGTVFESNDASAGGAFDLSSSTATFDQVLFHDNTANFGGGISMVGSNLTVTNSVSMAISPRGSPSARAGPSTPDRPPKIPIRGRPASKGQSSRPTSTHQEFAANASKAACHSLSCRGCAWVVIVE